MSPSFRGRGIAKKLMHEAIERVKTTPNIKQINLAVTIGQVAAQKLYDRLGFVVYGVEKQAMQIDGRFFDEEHRVLFLE